MAKKNKSGEITQRMLDREIASGNVIRRESLCGNFVVYNYSPEVQFEKKWNPINVQARGIIFDLHTGEIVARPFPKFFNLGEVEGVWERAQTLGEPEIAEKLDGSLGIVFWDKYANDIRVSTRGSLDSEQAVWATEWLRDDKNSDIRDGMINLMLPTDRGLTPLCEIIYPGNRIVVDYGDNEKLPIVGLVDLHSGEILSQKEVRVICRHQGLDVAKDYTDEGIDKILKDKSVTSYNEEGWVLMWFDKNDSTKRLMLKVKGDQYLAVHRIRFGLTPKALIDMMEAGSDPLEFAAGLPDEFHKEIKDIVKKITLVKDGLRDEAMKRISVAPRFDERRDAAFWAKSNLKPEDLSIFFSSLDGKDASIDRILWKRTREIAKRWDV